MQNVQVFICNEQDRITVKCYFSVMLPGTGCFIKTSLIPSTYIFEYNLRITKFKTRISMDNAEFHSSVESYKLKVASF
jgi:hypothetical protein